MSRSPFSAVAAVLALLATSCAPDPVPTHAFLTTAAPFGSNQDPQTAAIDVSAWLLASPSRYQGNPRNAALAVAGVDYMAGDLYANPLHP